jgi:hypothetical protein
MLPRYATYRRRAIEAYSVALMSTTALAVIVFVLPKPEAYGAPARLAMTAAVFATVAGGLVGWVTLRRRVADAGLAFRYHGASSALTTTVAYLSDERRAARRGVLPALVGAVSLLGLHVLAAWPQCAALAPFREALGPAAAGSIALAVLAPFWRRKNIINALYLRHCIVLQARQVGFKPRKARDARRLAAELARPAVSRATTTEFRAAGFIWRLDDFQKNAIIFGQTGSGKTIAVLNTLLEGMFASSAVSPLPAAGIILDAKGDFRLKVEALARRYGREKDLIIFSASDEENRNEGELPLVYNPLDSPDDELELSARLWTAAKLSGGLKVGDNSFFADAARIFVRHAIAFLRAANDRTPPSLLDVRRLATDRPEEVQTDGAFYLELSRAIFARYNNAGAMPAATIDALDYLDGEWKSMPDRQRGGVIGSVTQLLDEFSIEPFRSMLTGRSSFSLAEVIDTGRILYLDLPLASRPRMATLITGLIKADFQREILKRPDKPRPSYLLADEYHLLWNTGEGQGDSEFFALSRQSNHANIVAAQNISSFYKRTNNQAEARNFLGNCATKVFLRNSEYETIAWASQLFGERAEINIGSNETASLNHPVMRGMTSYARSITTARIVPPEAFAKLAIPMRGSRVNQYAETIVHLAGRDVTQRLDLAWPVNPL